MSQSLRSFPILFLNAFHTCILQESLFGISKGVHQLGDGTQEGEQQGEEHQE